MTQLNKSDLPVSPCVSGSGTGTDLLETIKGVDQRMKKSVPSATVSSSSTSYKEPCPSTSMASSSSSVSANGASTSGWSCMYCPHCDCSRINEEEANGASTSAMSCMYCPGPQCDCSRINEEDVDDEEYIGSSSIDEGCCVEDDAFSEEDGTREVPEVEMPQIIRNKRARLAGLSLPASVITTLEDNSIQGITGIEEYSTHISLPAPMPSFSIGNACGGNQSYAAMMSADLPRRGDMTSLAPSSSSTITDFSGPTSSINTSLTLSLGGFRKTPGVVGLANLGNTCFMNSGLQSLINTPPIVEFFLKSPVIKHAQDPTAALATNFQNLLRNAWNGPLNVIHPREFKETLGNIFPQFKDCRQHDCQEFLALTLDVLHEQLKVWNNTKRDYEKENETSSSGFASGAPESETVSTANDSDVSSSLQSPASSGEPDVLGDGQKSKKRKLSSEPETSSPSSSSVVGNSSSDESKPSGNSEGGGHCDSESPNNREQGADEMDENGHVDPDLETENEMEIPEDSGDNEKDKSIVRARKEANEFWMNYIRDNITVIASSFQGMYKSTVTCSVCNYVSPTFEPFMYLSLPIPRIMERKFDVFYAGWRCSKLQNLNVTMHVEDNVGQLKQKVVEEACNEVGLAPCPMNNYVVVEVVNYHIHHMLKDDQSLKSVKDGIFDVYVLELNSDYSEQIDVVGDIAPDDDSIPSNTFCGVGAGPYHNYPYIEENWETDVPSQSLIPEVNLDTDDTPMVDAKEVGGGDNDGLQATPTQPTYNVEITDKEEDAKEETASNPEGEELISCSVCLDDFSKSKLKQHYGCSCILCSQCITGTMNALSSQSKETSTKTTNQLKCPVCSEVVDHTKSFVSLSDDGSGPRKMVTVPLLFHSAPDTNNNASFPGRLIGHPWAVQLPAILTSEEFYSFLARVVPFSERPYSVINASWDGKECGACSFNQSCKGCEFKKEGHIAINSRNSIRISYACLDSDLIASIEPSEMKTVANPYAAWNTDGQKEEPPIDIYECLDTFSQTEMLDEQNPWFCPACQQHQCATKSLTICHLPKYLIVYLKRFVYVDNANYKLNNKLRFPREDFDLSRYIAEEYAGSEEIYDLYSCVCHFGSSMGGHYTCYCKNPKSETWNYFNDDGVSDKAPSESEYSSGYILFYAKKGLKVDIEVQPRNIPFPSLTFPSKMVDTDAGLKESEATECDTTSLPQSGCCNNPAESTTTNGSQEETISSTSVDNLHSSTSTSCNDTSSPASEKVNHVRENVSNLHIDINRRKRMAEGSSTSTGISTSTSRVFDEDDFEEPQIKPYSEFAENKRLTKVAQRSKNLENAESRRPL